MYVDGGISAHVPTYPHVSYTHRVLVPPPNPGLGWHSLRRHSSLRVAELQPSTYLTYMYLLDTRQQPSSSPSSSAECWLQV